MAAEAIIDTCGSHHALRATHFMVECAVVNPFCGRDVAVYSFVQRKVADSIMEQRLDEVMQS